MQAIAADPADRWPQVGVMGAEIETITEGCLASTDEIAQMLRRREQGEPYAPPVEVLPNARSSAIPPEPPAVVEEASSFALVLRPRPSMPDLGDGVISWSGPRSARQPSWEDDPRTESESIGVSEPDVPNFGPRPSMIGWAAVGFGVLSAIAAFVLLKREPSSEVAESKPVATQIVVAPKVMDAPAPAPPDEPAPTGRPPIAAQGGRAVPTRQSSPPRAMAPAVSRSATTRASPKVGEPAAPPAAPAPAESAEPPPPPKPKEDLFGI
jgi:hypothetical protein